MTLNKTARFIGMGIPIIYSIFFHVYGETKFINHVF